MPDSSDISGRSGQKDPPSTTVADLLPAMVELSSIQLDLMRLMVRKPVPAGMVLYPQTRWDPGHDSTEADMQRLQQRGTVLLRWLLDRAKRGGELE